MNYLIGFFGLMHCHKCCMIKHINTVNLFDSDSFIESSYVDIIYISCKNKIDINVIFGYRIINKIYDSL